MKSGRDVELHNHMFVNYVMVLWHYQCMLLEIALLLLRCGNQLYQQGPKTFFSIDKRGRFYGILRMKVEAKVLLEGLKLAWDWDFRQIELECDNVLLMKWLGNNE
ncbi:hypothetical protein PVK06_038966 [Gossypium arboreum]|uniref:RNase H type-1 domain-containing protein n=1 Tax=Gossypium arboreum TaxID=29729 RepID=A0ABR0N236_GOSAR|nr:hypothetical protein PVK06_038966 [Gossypium arboreum]